MLNHYTRILCNVILLASACLVFFALLTHASNEVRESTFDEDDQFCEQNTSASSDNQLSSPGSESRRKHRRADCPLYLSLTKPASKIKLIEQKEIELKNQYSTSVEFPMQSGHHWNLAELSDTDAMNICYSLWSGLTFSEIDEIDHSNLPSKLYPYCNKSKKIPIRDISDSGTAPFSYTIVYPYTESNLKCKHHRISVLKCVCKLIRTPRRKVISNNSNRCFFAHKFKDNEYLVLSNTYKNSRRNKILSIIDVQEVDPTAVHHGEKTSIPIFTGFGNQSTSPSDDNQTAKSRRRDRTDLPTYLSLTSSDRKTDEIIHIENTLKNNLLNSVVFPKQPGHHWNLSLLSENAANDVCYSLWLGLKFSEIDETDKTDLPPHLYPYCMSKKVPIGDIRDSGVPNFSYNLVYPHMEKDLITKHHISVLKCVCRFTLGPLRKIVSYNSNRKFFAHNFKLGGYLVLSPLSKERYKHHDLRIIDVQEVDPTLLHFGDKRNIPISTNYSNCTSIEYQ